MYIKLFINENEYRNIDSAHSLKAATSIVKSLLPDSMHKFAAGIALDIRNQEA